MPTISKRDVLKNALLILWLFGLRVFVKSLYRANFLDALRIKEIKMANDTLVEGKVVKSGFKTSEFIVTVLSVIGSAAASFAGVLDPKIAGVLMAISSVAYAISRGLAKGS